MVDIGEILNQIYIFYAVVAIPIVVFALLAGRREQ